MGMVRASGVADQGLCGVLASVDEINSGVRDVHLHAARVVDQLHYLNLAADRGGSEVICEPHCQPRDPRSGMPSP